MSDDLYDVEAALRAAAHYRRRNDKATRAQVELADRLATNMTKHYPEGLEQAGTALVLAAASLGVLAAEKVTPEVIINILAFAGQRMVLDARAAGIEAVEFESWRVHHPGLGVIPYRDEASARVAAGTAGRVYAPGEMP